MISGEWWRRVKNCFGDARPRPSALFMTNYGLGHAFQVVFHFVRKRWGKILAINVR